MKFKSAQTLQEIATLIDARFIGKSDFEITGINEIHVVESGDIVFVDHPKYYDKALNSKATTILIKYQNILVHLSTQVKVFQTLLKLIQGH